MADNVEVVEQTEQVTETATEPTLQEQIAEQMNFRLNGGEPPKQEAEPVVTEPTVTATEPPVFQFNTFTEKYGWQTPDDAQKEIEELRNLKANPVKEELKFENEKSQKIVRALQAEKFDEVYEILHEERQLNRLTTAEVTKDTADDIIKLSMQIKYKEEGLTADDVNYKFGKMYKLPKEPIKGDLDDDTEFEEKHNEWKETVADIEAGKIIDAKIAKKELEAAKSKIVYPNIESAVDQDYLQYKKSLEDDQKLEAETKEAYKAFVPKVLETKMNFNDEANKIAFEFQYEPTPEDFAKSIEVVVDPEKFWNRYKNSDGTPNRQLFLQDVHFILNKDKVMMEAMKQSKNATLKSQLADNSQGGFQRQIPQTQEPNELHKQMMAAGVVK